MTEHLQSDDQTIAPEDSAWLAMPRFCEIGCALMWVPPRATMLLEVLEVAGAFNITMSTYQWSAAYIYTTLYDSKILSARYVP